MKIGIISTITASQFGGSEELIVELSKISAGRGHKVFVSIYNWGCLHPKWQNASSLGVKIEARKRIHYTSIGSKVLSKIFYNRYSYRQLRNFSNKLFDIMIVNLGSFRNLETGTLLNLLETYKGRYILICHGSSESYHCPFNLKGRIRDVCKRAAKVYFVSKRIRLLAERNIGYSFSNSEIILNPINIPKAGILPFPDTEMLELAAVGTLITVVKGQALLLQVLGQDCWKSRLWKLNIYGEGSDLNYLKYLADFYQISKNVIFHGYVKDVANEIWAKNHLLVAPSYEEGLPLALMEAMLCGRSAVVTDVGGNAEVMNDNYSGFIAEGTTFPSFYKAMERMWERRSELHIFGRNAYTDATDYIKQGVNLESLLNYLEGSDD